MFRETKLDIPTGPVKSSRPTPPVKSIFMLSISAKEKFPVAFIAAIKLPDKITTIMK